MANENKNINELVSDDEDPTAELDASSVRRALLDSNEDAEADANTFDFDNFRDDLDDGVSVDELKSDLRARSETIERLQFDVQQLHAKWLGLEVEIKAREETTRDLNAELKSVERKLTRKEQLIGQRDRTIKSLKAEIRERDQKFRDVQTLADEYLAAKNELEAGDEVNKARERLHEYEGRIAGLEASLEDMRMQQTRTESYADELRRKFTSLDRDSEGARSERDELREAVAEAAERVEALQGEVDAARAAADDAAASLQKANAEHERELRTLRFELGEAQETLSERDELSEELASELVDTRNSKVQLEGLLAASESQYRQQLDELEKQVSVLQSTVDEYEEKLASKSDAINCLLAELAKKSREIESIGEMEDVIHDIDDRISERIDDRSPGGAERVTRLLVGRIDQQELRFPLFKDRLTIGRAQQNDIQLKAQHISRRHAVVLTEGDATRVIDWGSKNGVYVNSRRVSEQFLTNGDILTIGTAKFRYEERPKRDS